MKIRSSFVSNSSSSSFIVTFPEVPSTKEKLAEMMGDCSANGYSVSISKEEVVNTVWSDIKRISKPLGDEVDFIECLDIRGLDTTYLDEILLGDFADTIREAYYTDDIKISFEEVLEAVKRNLENLKLPRDGKTFKFTYSDNDGSYWSAMEHGDVFRNIPHERISHH